MTESEAIEAIKFDLKIGGEIHSQVLRNAVDVAIQALEEVQKYREIGSMEECRVAREKQMPKKVKNSGERIPFEWYCPTCGELLCDDGYKDTDIKYCEHCGQKLDWSDEA